MVPFGLSIMIAAAVDNVGAGRFCSRQGPFRVLFLTEDDELHQMTMRQAYEASRARNTKQADGVATPG